MSIDLEALFPGDGELARRMRAFDWAATPLGPPDDWPEHLRAALRDFLAPRSGSEAGTASRTQDEQLARIAHELRNPLSPILLSLQMLRMTAEPSPEVLDLMERQIRRLTRRVDDLLDVSRLARGKLELREERIEIADAIERAVELAGPRLAEGGNRVEQHAPRGLAIDADLDRLAQVLANLVDNAARFSAPGSRIEITAARTGDHVRVIVRDEGEGIAPELLGHVFDLFAQRPPSLDRPVVGLGLGLAIARDLVELHGGTIAAHSDGPGRGSVFTVELPAPPAAARAPAPAPAAAPPPAPAPSPATLAIRYRILVVDDNAEAALTLRQALQLLGHAVELAHDGPAALALAEAFAPDVALLDLALPGMDGYELARRLREQHTLRLIAVTGSGRSTDRARARTAGFEQHLVKPIDLRMLRAALSRVPGARSVAG